MDGTKIDLSQETQALARRVAEAKHTSVDEAVRQALEAIADATGIQPEAAKPRDTSPEAIARRREATERIVAEFAAMPVLDPRDPHEIMDELNDL